MPNNVSYLFHKDYYHNRGSNTLDWSSNDDAKHKGNKAFFDFKNKQIFGESLVTVPSIKAENGFSLETLYPGLFYGAGLTHETGSVGELKLGFQLDFTTGMPVLMGSSIKGLIRAYFPHFKEDAKKPLLPVLVSTEKDIDKKNAEENTIDKKKKLALYIARQLRWIKTEEDFHAYLEKKVTDETISSLCQQVHELELSMFEGIDIDKTKAENKKCFLSIYKRDIFHEAIPIQVENKKLFGIDSITPHISHKEGVSYEQAMLKNPTPLPFLKVLPQVIYQFQFHFKETNLREKGLISPQKKTDLARNILTTFGIGAKTNVGYGQFKNGKEWVADNYEEAETGEKQAQTGNKTSLLPIPVNSPEFKILRADKDKIEAKVIDNVNNILKLQLFVKNYPNEWLNYPFPSAAAYKIGTILKLQVRKDRGTIYFKL